MFKEERARDTFANPVTCCEDRIIVDHIYHAITGTPRHWLAWFLTEYVKDVRPLHSVLSICCGDGLHELYMMKSREWRFLRAFDISEDAIKVAVERFEQESIPRDRYLLDVRDANNLERSKARTT